MRIYKNDILYSQGDNADDSKCLNFKIKNTRRWMLFTEPIIEQILD